MTLLPSLLAFAACAAPVAAPARLPALNLLILGPAGSSKGTQAENLAAETGAVPVSIGRLLNARADGLPDPALKAVLDRGDLADPAIVREELAARFSRPDVRERKYSLDGLRTEADVDAVQAVLTGELAPDAVLVLAAPEDELLRRILARGRSDDTREAFERRMTLWRERTLPAIALLRRLLPVLDVDVSSRDRGENWERVRAAVASLFDGGAGG